MLQAKRVWKLYVRDEYYRPPTVAYTREEYTSKDAALEGAYQLMYGRASRAYCKVLWIEGPNGGINQQKIEEYLQARQAGEKVVKPWSSGAPSSRKARRSHRNSPNQA
jgi:hypothetical protein